MVNSGYSPLGLAQHINHPIPLSLFFSLLYSSPLTTPLSSPSYHTLSPSTLIPNPLPLSFSVHPISLAVFLSLSIPIANLSVSKPLCCVIHHR